MPAHAAAWARDTEVPSTALRAQAMLSCKFPRSGKALFDAQNAQALYLLALEELLSTVYSLTPQVQHTCYAAQELQLDDSVRVSVISSNRRVCAACDRCLPYQRAHSVQ